MVVLSPVPGHRSPLLLDPQGLADMLGDDAEIAALADHDATQALCALLPDRLRFGTGSARIFFPGAGRDDHPRRHPWIYVDRAWPERAAQTIVAFLRPEPVAVWCSTDRRQPIPSDPLFEARKDLAEARARISSLTAERKRLRRDLAELRSCSDYRYTPPAVYANPAVQFRYEIEQHWLHTLPEKERDQCPLAQYDLGPDFLDSLETLQVVGRSAILTATVDVLTGQASAKNGRRAHRQRVSRGGSTAPLVRADGASGWRCDIRSNTPAAPRLLWWALPDGRIELARAAVHDDHAMR
ncbi:hypothetical protein ABH935_004157 [Catenulispora sp. GAS73]|uniref:hypothetical protein n=1 Tax=Catenulispora sp. GAS73 TaxID=3156269 RepID=UPI003510FAE6